MSDGIPINAFNRAIAMARELESQGYFSRVREGDQRAASYFARLVAHRLNPAGLLSDFGWLSKSPGESQVEGFAEDAIVYSNDESNLENVIDLVNGAGAPGASIGGGIKPRRPNNRWVKPEPLTDEQMKYLRPGETAPIPPAPRPLEFPPRDLVGVFFAALDKKYQDRGARNRVVDGEDLHVNNEGIFVWVSEFLRRYVTGDHAPSSINPRDRAQAATEAVMADIDKVK